MIGLYVVSKDVFLDIEDSTVLTLTLNSTAYFGGDPDLLPGSFSWPVKVKDSSKNLKALQISNRLDAIIELPKFELVIYYDGAPILTGTAEINDLGDDFIEIVIGIVDFSEIQNVKMNQLDLGGDRNMGPNVEAALVYAKQTYINPDATDFIFFPIYNPEFGKAYFLEQELEVPEIGKYQNFWQDGNFVSSPDQMAAMPFVKVNYLLDRIFGQSKYSFENAFQTTTELKRLCVYNNYSIYTEEGEWGTTINLQNHVSATKSGEFAKKLFRLFNLMAVVNIFDSHIKLVPLKDVATAPVKYDWTEKKVKGYTFKPGYDVPGTFTYAGDGGDAFVDKWEDSNFNATEIETVDDADGPGFYYVYSKNAIFKEEDPPSAIIKAWYDKNRQGKIVVDPSLETFESDLTPIQLYNYLNNLQWELPRCDIPGTILSAGISTSFTDRLIIYRGQVPHLGINGWPFAGPVNYWQQIRSGDYSLLWNGPYGIFNQWWAEWLYMLIQKKDTSFVMDLDLSDIVNFTFDNKIRIDNQNYLIKSMVVTLTNSGIKPTKINAITTL